MEIVINPWAQLEADGASYQRQFPKDRKRAPVTQIKFLSHKAWRIHLAAGAPLALKPMTKTLSMHSNCRRHFIRHLLRVVPRFPGILVRRTAGRETLITNECGNTQQAAWQPSSTEFSYVIPMDQEPLWRVHFYCAVLGTDGRTTRDGN